MAVRCAEFAAGRDCGFDGDAGLPLDEVGGVFASPRDRGDRRDKAARLICRVSRGAPRIALPGALTAVVRALRVAPPLLRDRLRKVLAAPAEPVADPIAEEPLAERSASGN